MKTSFICAACTIAAVAANPTHKKHNNCGDKPLVSSDELQKLINIEDLLAGSQQLQDFAYAYPERNRVFGGQGHNDTINWLAETLDKTGYYDVTIQPFVELFSGGNASLTLNGEDEQTALFTYTASGQVTGDLVAVNNLGCEPGDFPADVTGNVALVSRGNCTFAIKATNAKAAGAGALVVYDNVPSDAPPAGTLGGAGDYVPTVGITQASGNELVAALTAGTAYEAVVDVNAILENRTTYNVIAETKCGDHDNVISLGGHSDSVEAGPGINDDGSGIVGNLRVAQALTKFSVKNAVRFFFWSAEEFGLLGSEYYVRTLNESATEIAKIRAYLNFDMIASPNYIYGIYDGDGNAFNLSGPAGSAQIEKTFEDFFKAKGENSVPTDFSGRSDYGPFLDVGIAAGGLFTGAEVLKTEAEVALFGGTAGVAYDENYHQEGDNIDNLNREAYLLNTQAIADSVAKYALDLSEIPVREAAVVKRDLKQKRSKKATRELVMRSSKSSHGHACGHSAPALS